MGGQSPPVAGSTRPSKSVVRMLLGREETDVVMSRSQGEFPADYSGDVIRENPAG